MPLLSLYIPDAAKAIEYGTARLLLATVPCFWLACCLDIHCVPLFRYMGEFVSGISRFVELRYNRDCHLLYMPVPKEKAYDATDRITIKTMCFAHRFFHCIYI